MAIPQQRTQNTFTEELMETIVEPIFNLAVRAYFLAAVLVVVLPAAYLILRLMRIIASGACTILGVR